MLLVHYDPTAVTPFTLTLTTKPSPFSHYFKLQLLTNLGKAAARATGFRERDLSLRLF